MSNRVLVVESDPRLCKTIAGFAQEWVGEVLEAHSAAEARQLLEANPQLMILDDSLPDGDALCVTEHAMRRRPAPAIVVMSDHASAQESFRLARAGALGFVAKPLRADALRQEVSRALEEAPSLVPAAVGGRGQEVDARDPARGPARDGLSGAGDVRRQPIRRRTAARDHAPGRSADHPRPGGGTGFVHAVGRHGRAGRWSPGGRLSQRRRRHKSASRTAAAASWAMRSGSGTKVRDTSVPTRLGSAV